MSEKLLYLDCFSGIAGDMTLGALIDLGVDAESLVSALKTLPLSNWSLEHRVERRMGLRGIDVQIKIGGRVEGPAQPIDDMSAVPTKDHYDHGPHRHYQDIIDIIRGGDLPGPVQERALEAFDVLADAEAHVHGIEREAVHFHEVGATDSIIDIVGCVGEYGRSVSTESNHRLFPWAVDLRVVPMAAFPNPLRQRCKSCLVFPLCPPVSTANWSHRLELLSSKPGLAVWARFRNDH